MNDYQYYNVANCFKLHLSLQTKKLSIKQTNRSPNFELVGKSLFLRTNTELYFN